MSVLQRNAAGFCCSIDSSLINQSLKKKEIQIIKTFSLTLKCMVTTVKKTVIVIIICNIRLVFIQLSSLISSFFQDKDKNRKGEENAKPTKKLK